MQCEIAKIIYPKWAYQWINIKNTFTEFYSIKSGRKLKKTFLHFLISCSFSFKKGIRDMLDKLGLSFLGNLHSGLDDATNIGRIVIELIKVNKYIKKSF
jgi:3'-5' exoribonuclease 1